MHARQLWRSLQVAVLALSLQGLPVCAQSGELTALFQSVRQLYQQGKYVEAIPLAQQNVGLTRALYGDADSRTLIAQKNLVELFDSAALLYEAQGLVKEAMRLRLQGLAVLEQAFGRESLEVSSSLMIIGDWYRRQGIQDQAEQVLRRALSIRQQTLPARDPDLIESLRQLGDLLASQGRYQEAAQFHSRVPPPPPPPLGAYRPAGGLAFPDHEMLVFFGTNRQRRANEPDSFGSEAANEQSVGYAVVDISAETLIAGLKGGNDGLLKFADPRHLSIEQIQTLDNDALLAEVRPRIQKAINFPRQAFVFVHGFNVSFDNALRRAAQLEHDLGFDGAAFVYSWPSHGQLGESDYFADQRSSMAAAGDLRAFFEFVVAKSGASVVHLIAHSMGNPLMIEALKQLQSKPDWADLHIGQIILAAPDMDAAEFATAIPSLRNVVTGITLYASASDKALVVSQLVNGGRGHRAGFVSAAQGPVVVDGVDAIDVTGASMDILSLNHSAYAESAVLLEDMKKVLHGVRPPDIREPSMQHINVGTRAYWHYQPLNP